MVIVVFLLWVGMLHPGAFNRMERMEPLLDTPTRGAVSFRGAVLVCCKKRSSCEFARVPPAYLTHQGYYYRFTFLDSEQLIWCEMIAYSFPDHITVQLYTAPGASTDATRR